MAYSGRDNDNVQTEKPRRSPPLDFEESVEVVPLPSAAFLTRDPFGALLGSDPALERLKRVAREIAETDVSILIRGETGTGKEILAHAIHAASRRATGPMVVVHCAALRDDLANSELFGSRPEDEVSTEHEQLGKVGGALGGTLVLDEIGDLSLVDQDRLRRLIDSSETADVRLIAISNRDLDELAAADRFRSELLYRLRVVTLDLPPLKRRPDDIELLINAFLPELAECYSKRPPAFSLSARKALRRYGWPGNVRELRNFCEQMTLTRSGRVLRAEDLPLAIRFPGNPRRDTVQLPQGGIRLDDWVAELLRQALAQARGNRSQAARLLGISRDTLNYRIKKYSIKS